MNTLLLGKGLDNIKFGISREELKKILGEPEEIESFPPDTLDDFPTETWHYDKLEISASFIEEGTWKLESIAVSSADFALEGKKLMGLSLEKVIKEIESINLGEIDHEDLSSDNDTDYQLISVNEKSIHFWFDNEILNEISWGPFYDEDDNPLWP
jgi:hypothetical protein